jgi:hypothetical protein
MYSAYSQFAYWLLAESQILPAPHEWSQVDEFGAIFVGPLRPAYYWYIIDHLRTFKQSDTSARVATDRALKLGRQFA